VDSRLFETRAVWHAGDGQRRAAVCEHQPVRLRRIARGFVYDESRGVIYLHTARVGRTRANVDADARVCFSVSEMGRFLPADTALGFSVEYAGVVVFGRAEVAADPDEARRGLLLLLDKYFPHLKPGQDYRPITDEELARTAVYRIKIDSWSGKQKAVAPDFPGAFFYGQAGS
jgi:hypothetical protein